MTEKLKVIELQCQNIMFAKSVKIKPDGAPVVVIGGNNGEGKSSLMNSLVVGLCGKRERVAMPVTKGEQQGAVRIGLGKAGEKPLYVITQRLNPDSLKVERTDGQPLGGTPRSVLDAKLGQLAFNPLALIQMKPAEQADLVRSIYGIDVSAIEVEYATVYEDRRQANASLKAQTTILETFAGIDFSELPDAPIDVAEAMEVLDKLNAANALRATSDATISRLQERRAELEQQFTNLRDELQNEQADREALGSIEGTAELEVTIRTAGEVNAALEKKAQAEHQQEIIELIETNVTDLNSKLKELKESKNAAVSAAELPEGLSFGETGLELNGVPFEQAATTEQITIGFELAIKDDPEIGITFVRDASLLDKKHRAYIESLAVEYGVQAWFEIVGDDDPAAFIIEGGEVIREPKEV